MPSRTLSQPEQKGNSYQAFKAYHLSAGAKSLGIPVNVITAGRQASGNCSQPQPGSAKLSQNSYDYTQCSSNTSHTNPQIRSAEIGVTIQTVAEVNEDATD